MRIAIMQPYFFPYVGYFSLIKHTNRFILLDTVQFIRHGWIERNRVLKQTGGWVYIRVPVVKNAGRSTLINNVLIDNRQKWKEKILAQLQHYKKIAPYYPAVMEILGNLFRNEYEDIVSLNKAALEIVCAYLGFKASISVFSEMGLVIEEVNSPDEWALNICKAVGGIEEYWNPEGGIDFFDTNKYVKNGIKIRFIKMNLFQYRQNGFSFEPNLSILDVLMFNDVAQANRLIDDFHFL